MSNLIRLCRNQWDRTLSLVLIAAGLIALLAGWAAVGDTSLTFRQIPYLMSGGLMGLCLVALGATLWLSADLRDEWRKLDRLETKIDRAVGPRLADLTDISLEQRAGDPSDHHLVASEG